MTNTPDLTPEEMAEQYAITRWPKLLESEPFFSRSKEDFTAGHRSRDASFAAQAKECTAALRERVGVLECVLKPLASRTERWKVTIDGGQDAVYVELGLLQAARAALSPTEEVPEGYFERVAEVIKNSPKAPEQDTSRDPPGIFDEAVNESNKGDASSEVQVLASIPDTGVDPGENGTAESLRRDAERYRFLRSVDPDAELPRVMLHRQNDWGNWYNEFLEGDELDAAVDAARTPTDPPTQPNKDAER